MYNWHVNLLMTLPYLTDLTLIFWMLMNHLAINFNTVLIVETYRPSSTWNIESDQNDANFQEFLKRTVFI